MTTGQSETTDERTDRRNGATVGKNYIAKTTLLQSCIQHLFLPDTVGGQLQAVKHWKIHVCTQIATDGPQKPEDPAEQQSASQVPNRSCSEQGQLFPTGITHEHLNTRGTHETVAHQTATTIPTQAHGQANGFSPETARCDCLPEHYLIRLPDCESACSRQGGCDV